jgi:hypothetical protein
MSTFNAFGSISTGVVDTASATSLSLGTGFSNNVNIGKTATGTTTVNNALTSTGLFTATAGINTTTLDTATATALSLGTGNANNVNIGKTSTGTTTVNNALTATGLTTANGGLSMGAGKAITIQPATGYVIPAVGQIGYTYYAFLTADTNVPSSPATSGALLQITNVPVGTYSCCWQYRLMNTNATGSSVSFTMGHLTIATPYVLPSTLKTPKFSAISTQNYTQAVSSTSGAGNNQANTGNCIIQIPSIQSIDMTVKVEYVTTGGTLQYSALDGSSFPNTYLILTRIA